MFRNLAVLYIAAAKLRLIKHAMKHCALSLVALELAADPLAQLLDFASCSQVGCNWQQHICH